MAVNEDRRNFRHPVYQAMAKVPGLSVAVGSIDALLNWGSRNALWVFPMATSCCGIELMAAAAARVDLDRMGAILRGTPRQADVMVVAGTITVKMAPRVRKLWDQMPEPKWCIAMGSCAISGDFYRDVYSVVPGVDTLLPVDVYVPGCPPNPEALMEGLLRLREKVRLDRQARQGGPAPEPEPKRAGILPALGRVGDDTRDPALTAEQTELARTPGEEAGRAPFVRPFVPRAQQPSSPAEPLDLSELLRARFGIAELPKDAPPRIPADRHLELAEVLKDAGYTSFCYVVASHWPAPAAKEGEAAAPDELEVAYGLRRPARGAKLASWRVRVPASEPVPSLTPLFLGADWQEREQQDLVGVRFSNHPDPRRILLPDAWEGYPLRRDYPLDKSHRPWR